MSGFFLVRHGETMWNKCRKYQGQTDVPLNDTGREQACKLSVRLEKQRLDAVYASDLGRAIETARIIAKPHNIEVVGSRELREINFGIWEGYNFEEIMNKWPNEYKKWLDEPWYSNPPGGETLNELTFRVKKFFNEAAARHPDQNVLVVTHAGPIRAFLSVLLRLEKSFFWKFKISNASLTIVNYNGNDDDSYIVSINDTCHTDQ